MSIDSFFKKVTRPFRHWLLLHLAITCLWSINLSFKPYLLKKMLDQMSRSSDLSLLAVPAAMYILQAIVMSAAFLLLNWLSLKFVPAIKRHCSLYLMEHTINHSHEFYLDQLAGSLASKVKDIVAAVPNMLALVIDGFIGSALALCIAIITLATVDFKIALFMMGWAIAYTWLAYRTSLKGIELNRQVAKARSHIMGGIVDTFTNIFNVRLFTGKEQEIHSLSALLDAGVLAEQKRWRFVIQRNGLQDLLFILYQAGCILSLAVGFSQGVIDAGDLALVLTLNISLIDMLRNLSREFVTFTELVGTLSQGLHVLMGPHQIESPDTPLQVREGNIEVKEISFGYGASVPLFENLSFQIKGGQKVGIVGLSGSGKSTLVNLILRLFELQSGQILIDRQNIRAVSLDTLRQSIVFIPQDPILFHRSLMENIRYARPSATDQEVQGAAKKAHIDAFIEGLPQKYETLVGDRGIKLSGGQRQRIALARAFLKNAPILILDEATSQLDSITEQQIQESLWDLMHGKTTLIIAHRLSTLLKMDRIFVFHEGKIVQEGSHDTLSQERGLYRKLWENQSGGFIGN
ncbi:MAG: transporter permease/ATP-binding protein [Chlamydiales bacterium]|jgi:ATP-binding cassette subfamily B protein|nr:transporter permease/ATP-binding protein [Chlamydiales bacterium]